MSTATTRTGGDSMVTSARPATNFYTSKTTIIQAAGTATQIGYLWMSNPVPHGASVLSAVLRLYGKGVWTGGNVSVSVQRIATAWKQASLTYNTRPTVAGPIVTVTQANPADGTEWDFDVTAALNTISAGAPNYGFRVTTTSTTARTFYSLNQGGLIAPTLTVTWSDAPAAPHGLNPSAGRAVSVSQPVLSFVYSDPGATDQQALQVQIDAANNWTSGIDWDSGVVATPYHELDLSTTTYPGLGAGATTYWRARVQDAAGLWSDWSDPASFRRVNRGTLTLNNPAPGSPAFVSESSPPIIWTFSGRTQTRWRVRIANAARPTRYIVDQGPIYNNANNYDLPDHTLKDEDGTYNLTLDVWDDISDRVATSGDPVPTTVTRSFVYRDDPTPNMPGNPAIDFDTEGRPYVTLSWTRSTAPDYFSISRDGHFIAAYLQPDDLLVKGTNTTYSWVDKEASPNVPHTWGIRARVNRVNSFPAYVSGTLRTDVVWLIDPESDVLVAVLDAQLTLDMPEVASIYEPVSGEVAVRIVSAQRGAEGNISGRLTTFAGWSPATYENRMYWFKDRPTNTARLTVGTENYRVIVGNVVIAPIAGDATADRSVSFDWWDQDGSQ